MLRIKGSSYRSATKYWLGELYTEKAKKMLYGAPRRSSGSGPLADPRLLRLISIAQDELWVREKTGHNDGERVEEYLAAVGLKKGEPWCAAFVCWVFKQAGYSAPRTGWSPSLFPVSRLVKAAMPGNVFGIYFPALKRIGHCGIVAQVKGDWITGIEGNTNVAGSREGDGVYRKLRHRKTIRNYAGWTKGGNR